MVPHAMGAFWSNMGSFYIFLLSKVKVANVLEHKITLKFPLDEFCEVFRKSNSFVLQIISM